MSKGDRKTRVRQKKDESRSELKARKDQATEDAAALKERIDKMLDEHEGFHKQVVYHKGVPRLIPTDENGDFYPHRPLPPNTVMWCAQAYTYKELKEFITAGFVKPEELA